MKQNSVLPHSQLITKVKSLKKYFSFLINGYLCENSSQVKSHLIPLSVLSLKQWLLCIFFVVVVLLSSSPCFVVFWLSSSIKLLVLGFDGHKRLQGLWAWIYIVYFFWMYCFDIIGFYLVQSITSSLAVAMYVLVIYRCIESSSWWYKQLFFDNTILQYHLAMQDCSINCNQNQIKFRLL